MFKLVTLFILCLMCSQAFSHSARYPDAYQFDSSGEGQSVARSLVAGQLAAVPCVDASAGDYPCLNIDMQAFVPKGDIGGTGTNLNDIWGWTDILTGNEIAIVGRENGTVFVDVTDPINPVYLGFLPAHGNGLDSWRDIKVYADHAFIVADGSGNASHGLQIFDLTLLRTATPATTFSETAHHNGFGRAHNVAINEDSGFAYVVGSDQCSGGLYMVDISDPVLPQYAGCYTGDGYTHDVQCVTYAGPDTRFSGQEICAAYNEDTLTIVDVTDKENPELISRTPYADAQYTHQGWFLDDTHTYIVLDDELDEEVLQRPTRTYLFDVQLLDAPVLAGTYTGATDAIDHNLYTRDGYVFQSNYRAGLSILRADNIAIGELEEVAFFDTVPCSNSAQFSGTWSSYIYFASGTIVTSDIGSGLFVLSPNWDAINDPNNSTASVSRIGPNCGNSGDDPGNDVVGGSSSGGGGGVMNIFFIIFLMFIGATKKIIANIRKSPDSTCKDSDKYQQPNSVCTK